MTKCRHTNATARGDKNPQNLIGHRICISEKDKVMENKPTGAVHIHLSSITVEAEHEGSS